jgi:Flp pilus assembly protein TadD
MLRLDQKIEEGLAAYRRSMRAGARDEARVAVGRIVERVPHQPEAGFSSAMAILRDGGLEAGITVLRAVLAATPENAGARLILARALLAEGQVEAGEAELRALVAAEPPLPAAAIELAGALNQRGAGAEAIEVLQQAVEKMPGETGLKINLGGLLASAKRLDKARRVLESAIAQAPEAPLAHYNLARVQRGLGADEAAMWHFRQAVTLDPSLDQGWRNLGNALLDLGRVEEAFAAFHQGTLARRGLGSASSRDPQFFRTSASKLTHDIEQFRYLRQQGKLPEAFDETIAAYEQTLAELPAAESLSHIVDIPKHLLAALAPTYNRLSVCEPSPVITPRAVNPRIDTASVAADYAQNAPGIAYVDDFLTQAALEELRRFCLESTVWFQYRYGNGYLGAFFDDGFASPLLYQISEELRTAMPEIFGSHTLRKLWAFKYDSRLSGIPMHADFAAVNVNFWITPDDSNLEPDSGGLEIWDKEAPADWDFSKYNTDEAAMRRFLSAQNARSVKIPYRCNRVVIFNSDLFHATGDLHFRPGYENRRVNITMLYGKRQNA